MTTLAIPSRAETRDLELRVLETARDQLAKEDGFTSEHYFAVVEKDDIGDRVLDTFSSPGEQVGMTCAIGGVEQAIWLTLNNEDVSNFRHDFAYLFANGEDGLVEAMGAYDSSQTPDAVVLTVYGRIMGRLNRLATTMYGDDYGLPSVAKHYPGDKLMLSIEDLTTAACEEEDQQSETVTVFDAAIRELQAAA